MTILVVEDDINLNKNISFFLEKEGYHTESCFNGEDALYYCQEGAPDLILLDRMLPLMDGMDLLKKLRAGGNTTPVLILTALGTLTDRVEGLDAGADDYLVKPFEMEELLARIRSLLRRSSGGCPRDGEMTLECGDLSLSPQLHELQGPGGSVTLSGRENALLEILMNNAGKTLSRGQLLLKVWGPEGEVEEGNLDNYIFFLRRRIKSLGSSVTISTIRGVGYRMGG